jgi:maltose/moltooligosaccharide transporter
MRTGDAVEEVMPIPAMGQPSTNPLQKLYHVGTLTYTKAALINVFCWMLWGDLCLNMMESIIPRMVPLQLQKLGASNAVIGILTGSIFSLMNWIMNPLISTLSDRHRSKLGRRMPFMLYPTPFLALFLTLVGFSTNIAGYIRSAFPRAGNTIGHFFATVLPDVRMLPVSAQLTIGVIAVMLVLYKFFDLFPQCVYYYLFTDVIPQEVMGTFICLFRLTGIFGTIIFHYWLLQYADTHPRAIYLGCGVLYLIAFTLLSLMVKEGNYPPPPPKRKDPVLATASWFRESFSSPFYWKYFLTSACFRWSFVPFNVFLIVFAQKKLGMEAGEFGHSVAIALMVQMPLLVFLGPVLDRFHPVRVGIVGYVCMILAGVAGFFLIQSKTTFLIFTLMEFVAIAIFTAALSTMGPRLLPRQRYGQFCAANAMVAESGLLVLTWICGMVLDHFGERFIYLWVAVFSSLGLGMTFILFHAWKARGGDESYTPPEDYFPLPAGAAAI